MRISPLHAVLLSCLLVLVSLAGTAQASPLCFLASSDSGDVSPELTAISCDALPEGHTWQAVGDAPYDLRIATPLVPGGDCLQLSYAAELSDRPIVVQQATSRPGCSGAPLALRSTPASGYDLWLRADSGVTVNITNVTNWADQSASGNDAFMATVSRQPKLLLNAVNGLPAVRFDGAQSLKMTTPFGSNTFTIFVVGKNRKTSGHSMILGPAGTGAPNHQLRWEGTSSILYVGIDNGIPATTVNIGGNSAWHLLTVRYDGSTFSVYRNGILVGTRSFGTSGPWTLNQIGAWFSTYFMIGDVAELIYYDSALSSSSRTTTETYLRGKYALP